MPKKLFTPEQLQELENAVKQAESVSGGEIVPVFVKQSSIYELALWRSAFLFSLISGAIMILLYLIDDAFLFLPPYFWLLIPFTFGMLGALAAVSIPSFKRMMIGQLMMNEKVEAKAKSKFLDHGVSLTDQRSGVLILISFFEHKAIILADVGIAELIPDDVWQEIVSELTQGIKKGELMQSINQAILQCGKVIAESGLQKPDGGNNELSDAIIIEN